VFDAIVLCHVFPAFRRSGNKGFLFITIAAVLGIVDTVYDHTITLRGVSDQAYIFIRTLTADWDICRPYLYGAMGIVLLWRAPYFEKRMGSGKPPRPVSPAVLTMARN